MDDLNKLIKQGFYIRAKNGKEINIPIKAKVTLIKGDSATGKTKMINEIIAMISNNGILIDKCTVDIKHILVIRDANEFKILLNSDSEYKDRKIIFIDKFELTDFKYSIPFIENCNSFFVICCHKSLPKCGWERESIVELQHDGMHYTTKQINFSFKNGGMK